VCGTLYIFANRAYKACRSGQLSSNVRPQNRSIVTPRHSLSGRAFALALASVLTLAPLLGLHFRGFVEQTPTSLEKISYLNLDFSPPSTKKLEPAVAPAKPKIAASESRRTVVPQATPPPASSDPSAPAAIHEPPQPQATVPEAPNLPASAPIRLDAATISRPLKNHP
jgi:hypothetical protein